MAKDNKEGRKSTRSFDLNKSEKRSFELDKKSTRSFDLQKGDEEAVIGAGDKTAQQVAGAQPSQQLHKQQDSSKNLINLRHISRHNPRRITLRRPLQTQLRMVVLQVMTTILETERNGLVQP